jgi:hypothetical protein
MGLACSWYGGDEKCVQLSCGNLFESGHLEDQEGNGKICWKMDGTVPESARFGSSSVEA